MPTLPHKRVNKDRVEGTRTAGAVIDFTGKLNDLLSMYNEQAEIQDRKMVERLKGEADGILHASSLFSIIVSILLGMSYQPFYQVTSHLNLAQTYHLSTYQNNSLIRLPFDPSAVILSPTASAIWVNAFWSLSLAISLACFLFASLLQHWIRRYLHIVQGPRSPQHRVRIRELMAQGIDKHHLLWVVAALPSLFHFSIFLFLAGLLVSLSSTIHAVFMVVSTCVGACALLYLGFSLSPILHYDSPYYTPLSSLIWSSMMGIPWLILNLVYRVSERSHFIGYRTRLRVLDLAHTFHQLTFIGMTKAVEDLAETRVLELDTPALLKTFDSLEGDQDMEKFLVGLPGFYGSTKVERDTQALEHHHSHQFPRAIVAFMDRSWSSNVLSEDDKRRRIMICLDVMNMVPLLLQCTFRYTLLSMGSSIFKCVDFVIGAESHYGNPDLWTRHYAQCIVAVAISRVQELNGSWQDITRRQQDSFYVPLNKVSWNADNVKLINFIWISRVLKASYLTNGDQFAPGRIWHNVLSETLKFNARDTSSELRRHFCDLWDSLVAVTKDSPGYLMARTNAESFLSLISATHPDFHPGAALTVAAPYSLCHVDSHQLPTLDPPVSTSPNAADTGLLPLAAQKTLSDNSRSRILVVGKRGSGKSSLINTILKPTAMTMSHEDLGHDIETEHHSHDISRFIFHKSPVFRSGYETGLQVIRDFITERTGTTAPESTRLDAIWVCISIPNTTDGMVDSEAEEILCMGEVPVVVVFTHFDEIVRAVKIGFDTDDATKSQSPLDVAREQYEKLCCSLFAKDPRDLPAVNVSVKPEYVDLIEQLIEVTDKRITTSRIRPPFSETVTDTRGVPPPPYT